MVEALEARQLLAGDPSIVFPVPFGFEFDKPHGGVVDSSGRGTGFTSVQPNATSTEYRQGLIYLRPGVSLLRVKSRGDNYGNDNSLVNGLETTFSAANKWSISATVMHPFNIHDGGGEGIMFGPDCNNFIRLALVNRGGNYGIEFIDEQKISVHGGFRRQLSSTLTNIGSIGSISTLELILGGDSVTGRVRAYYRLNGGALQQLPAVIRLWPDKRKAFFSSEALAGICVFNAPGAETTVAVYDNFSITAGLPTGSGSGGGGGGGSNTLGTSTATKYFNDVRGGGGSPTQRVTLTNVGSDTITVSSISLSGSDFSQFFITGQPSGSFNLAPGGTESFSVGMSASSSTSLGIKTADISISSTGGSKTVPLRGLATAGQGGTNEPSLQRIMDLYQIPIKVGDPTPDTADLPYPLATPNDQVDLQRMVKAGSGDVTIEPLAVFGVGSSTSDGVDFGYYSSGNKDDKVQLLSVRGGGDLSQTVNPIVNGVSSFDPGLADFSLYMLFPAMYPTVVSTPGGTAAYGEDAFNTYDTTTQRKIRAYTFKNPDGTVVPNTYVIAGEDLNAAYDTQDFIAIIRNVIPQGSGPEVGFSNPEALPFDNRLLFNRISNLDPTYPNQVHDTASFSILNSGTQPLSVTGYDLSNGWEVLSGPSSFSLAPGASQSFTLKFISSNPGTGVNNQIVLGHMSFATNDADEPNATMELAGFWQNYSEHQMEPLLPQIIQMAGYSTTIVGSGQMLNEGGKVEAVGDEILSPYWTQANSSAPVTIHQLDSWHTEGDPATLYWASQGSTQTHAIFTSDGLDAQSFLPDIINTNTPAGGTFNSSGVFYFKVDNESSVDSQNVQEQSGGGYGHHVRFWPAKDREGNVIPNTYIMAMDYNGVNYDYNDNVYIISNIKPA